MEQLNYCQLNEEIAEPCKQLLMYKEEYRPFVHLGRREGRGTEREHKVCHRRYFYTGMEVTEMKSDFLTRNSVFAFHCNQVSCSTSKII
jgi:hypothetical protein